MLRNLPWLFAAVLAAASLFAPSVHAATPPPGNAPAADATTVTGTLEMVVADDFVRQREELHYSVRTETGDHVEVDFEGGRPANLRPGMRVRLHGRQDGRRFKVGRGKDAVEILADPPKASSLPAHNDRKVLLILTDIVTGDAITHALSNSCDATEDATAGIMFNGPGETVDGVYLDSSFGLEGIGGASYPGTALDVVRVQINEAASPLSAQGV